MKKCICGEELIPFDTNFVEEFKDAIQCPDCKQWFCDNCYNTEKGDGCHCHTLAKDIVWVQEPPNHPVAEYVAKEINAKSILAFLMDKDLPYTMSFSIDGAMYCFHTTNERIQWAVGFRQAWNLYKSG